MAFTEKEIPYVIKSTKLLLQYVMYFSNIRNAIFQVAATHPLKHEGEETLRNVQLMLFTAQPTRSVFVNNVRVDKPIFTDVHRFSTILELCPDLYLVDKVIVSDRISYNIHKVNYDLNFIRSEYYVK